MCSVFMIQGIYLLMLHVQAVTLVAGVRCYIRQVCSVA